MFVPLPTEKYVPDMNIQDSHIRKDLKNALCDLDSLCAIRKASFSGLKLAKNLEIRRSGYILSTLAFSPWRKDGKRTKVFLEADERRTASLQTLSLRLTRGHSSGTQR